MTVPHATANAITRATFNSAAAHFDQTPLFFWNHFGRRTVRLAGVRPGDEVLDVCCGTGASALPAAVAAGPAGHVTGVDLADRLLARAAAKARARRLHNIDFRIGDLTALAVPAESVDVAICVLGIYFAADLPAAVAGLWRTVRPGGTLAITTWGRRALEPANSLYLDAVAARCPGLRPAAISWERVNTPAALSEIFTSGGAPTPRLTHETVLQPLPGQDFWPVVLGSGYRLLIELLGQHDAAEVRRRLAGQLAEQRVHTLTSDVLYARARKPLPHDRTRNDDVQTDQSDS